MNIKTSTNKKPKQNIKKYENEENKQQQEEAFTKDDARKKQKTTDKKDNKENNWVVKVHRAVTSCRPKLKKKEWITSTDVVMLNVPA